MRLTILRTPGIIRLKLTSSSKATKYPTIENLLDYWNNTISKWHIRITRNSELSISPPTLQVFLSNHLLLSTNENDCLVIWWWLHSGCLVLWSNYLCLVHTLCICFPLHLVNTSWQVILYLLGLASVT